MNTNSNHLKEGSRRVADLIGGLLLSFLRLRQCSPVRGRQLSRPGDMWHSPYGYSL
jgi:hypothetical protein